MFDYNYIYGLYIALLKDDYLQALHYAICRCTCIVHIFALCQLCIWTLRTKILMPTHTICNRRSFHLM